MALLASLPLSEFSSQLVKDETLAQTPSNNVMGSAGKIFHLRVTNGSSSAKGHFKIWDQTTSVAHGTDHPVISFPVTASQDQGVTIAEGLTFTNAISWAFTDTPGTAIGSAVVGGTLKVTAIVRST